MADDREGPSILIRRIWLPSLFENIIFFHAKYYADISGSRKRHVSDFFTETQVQKVSSSMSSTSAQFEQNTRASRVAISHQLLEILQHCQATDFVNFLSEDESQFFLEHPHYGVWAASTDEVPETPMTTIDTEKCMMLIISSISGIQSLLALTKFTKYKYNSQYFCQHVIPDIQQNVCSSSRRKTLNGILLHLENASTGNSRLSSKRLNRQNPKECYNHLIAQA
jgi:hypothetical protein